MTLNLDFKYDDQDGCPESLRSLSLTEGFEEQDTIGGHSQPATPNKEHRIITGAVHAMELVDGSDSEEDAFVSREATLLVKI